MTEDDQSLASEKGRGIATEATMQGQGEDAPMESERLSRPAFFLTNRMNLNGILSSRILAPIDSFQKYYADLLALCPGWVPILTEPPSQSLLGSVVTERGAGGPVLLELTDDVLDGNQAAGSIAYLRAAPFSKVSAIHFPDEKSLREHRARGYKNVLAHDNLLRVSPDLFHGGDTEEAVVSPPQEAPTNDWTRIDRVRGAVNGLLAAGDSGESLGIAAAALGAEVALDDVICPPWLNWGELTGAGSTPDKEDAPSEADRLIFQAAYRVLGRHDKAESWSPRDVLDEVASEIASANPSAEAQKIVERNLQRVRELLIVEREFEPFRNPGSPFVAAKSFLMVLMRPELDQLLDWPVEETGADETTRSVAALLAGRLRGLSRESVKLRDVVLDDLTAEWAVLAVDGDTSPLGAAQFIASDSETQFLIDGKKVRESAPFLPDLVVLYEALGVRARPAARLAISRNRGWPVVHRIKVPPSSEVEANNSLITITSMENVKVETLVDEAAFLGRLKSVRGEGRGEVAGLLSKPK